MLLHSDQSNVFREYQDPFLYSIGAQQSVNDDEFSDIGMSSSEKESSDYKESYYPDIRSIESDNVAMKCFKVRIKLIQPSLSNPTCTAFRKDTLNKAIFRGMKKFYKQMFKPPFYYKDCRSHKVYLKIKGNIEGVLVCSKLMTEIKTDLKSAPHDAHQQVLDSPLSKPTFREKFKIKIVNHEQPKILSAFE